MINKFYLKNVKTNKRQNCPKIIAYVNTLPASITSIN